MRVSKTGVLETPILAMWFVTTVCTKNSTRRSVKRSRALPSALLCSKAATSGATARGDGGGGGAGAVLELAPDIALD